MTRRLLAPIALFLALGTSAIALDIRSSTTTGSNVPAVTNDEITINRADKRLIFKNVDESLGYGSLLNALASGRKAVEQGDGRDLSALEVGGGQSVTLPSRFGRVKRLRDRLGAEKTGSSDSFTALVGALNAAKSEGNNAVEAEPGLYELQYDVTLPANLTLFLHGAATTGPGSIENIGDLTRTGGYTFIKRSNTATTDNTVNIGLVSDGSASGANYQKSALFVRATINEGAASCTGANIVGCKDIVGATVSGNIGEKVAMGRAYGMNVTAAVPASSSGSVIGVETDIYTAPGVDRTADFFQGIQSARYAYTAIAYGGMSDAGYLVQSTNGGQWADGFRILRSGVRDYALDLIDDTTGDLTKRAAWIKASGEAMLKTVSISSVGSIVAAGTSQTTAPETTFQITRVISSPAGSGILVQPTIGLRQDIYNRSGTAIMVYAGFNVSIDGGPLNTGVSVPSGGHLSYTQLETGYGLTAP